MIQAQSLTKYFGLLPAIQDVTFSVEPGEIVGFLGPNGAGKSTTMRILSCVLLPTSGQATVAGYDVHRHSLEVRRRLGYFPENLSLYPEMSVERYLYFVAEMKGVKKQQRRPRVDDVVTKFGLEQVTKRSVGHLSKGYRQRVGLAQALLNEPEVLILDEPTMGLDPEQAAEFRTLIRGMRGERTILLSTHILSEVQAICDRVIIIHHGRLLALDTPEQLAGRLQRVSETLLHVRGPRAEVLRGLEQIPGVLRVREESQIDDGASAYIVEAERIPDIRPILGDTVIREGWKILLMSPRAMDLEEIFLRLVAEEEGSRS